MRNKSPKSARMAGSSRTGALTLLLLVLSVSTVDLLSSQTQSTSEEVRKMVSGNGTGQSGLRGQKSIVITRENCTLKDNCTRDPDVDDVLPRLPLENVPTNDTKDVTAPEFRPNIIRLDESGRASDDLLDRADKIVTEATAQLPMRIDLQAPRQLYHTNTTVTVRIRLTSFGVRSLYTLMVAEKPRIDMLYGQLLRNDVNTRNLKAYAVRVHYYRMNSSSDEDFIIGAENCNARSRVYCNRPLKPGTEYYVKLRVYDSTGSDHFIDSAYTEVYTDGPRALYRTDITVTVGIRLEPGAKLTYMLVVAEDPRNDTSADLPTWYDVQALHVWPPYGVPVQFGRYNVNSTYVMPFGIGEEECMSSLFYCNGPLKPGTKYYVKLRVYTNSMLDNFTDSAYTEVYTGPGDWKPQPPRLLRRSTTNLTVRLSSDYYGLRFKYYVMVAEVDRLNSYDVNDLDVWSMYWMLRPSYKDNLSSGQEYTVGVNCTNEPDLCDDDKPLKPGTKYYVMLSVSDQMKSSKRHESAYTEVYTAPADQMPRVLRQTATSVTVSFSFVYYGPQVFYKLVVAEDPSNESRYHRRTWSEVQALDVWPDYEILVGQVEENLSSVKEFVIGKAKCMDYVLYCNGPLKPSTKYYVKLRVYDQTLGSNYTDSAYTVFYTSDANTNYTVIIISIIFVTALILLVFFAVRKRCWLKYNEPSTPRLPTFERNPFYLNLLFRKQCAKEIADIEEMHYDEVEGHEHIYEEIDYAKTKSFENIIVPAATDSEINCAAMESTVPGCFSSLTTSV